MGSFVYGWLSSPSSSSSSSSSAMAICSSGSFTGSLYAHNRRLGASMHDSWAFTSDARGVSCTLYSCAGGVPKIAMMDALLVSVCRPWAATASRSSVFPSPPFLILVMLQYYEMTWCTRWLTYDLRWMVSPSNERCRGLRDRPRSSWMCKGPTSSSPPPFLLIFVLPTLLRSPCPFYTTSTSNNDAPSPLSLRIFTPYPAWLLKGICELPSALPTHAPSVPLRDSSSPNA
ncbi:hypothetical protein DFP72DRAFT_909849 [Ephemerocybe angulata]|uniref:Uncharacterized protein n=1 Tax=Ephemerocybe angulata TaxID=980116 RepID=A0A8H6HRS9_9AGAR|nr:hypothetical protein DFP72DRAFT_909849 [Tulosesus angulatus]